MTPIDYTIIRRPRRKTASIIVKPDKTVQIVVPEFLSDDAIAKLFVKKTRWINSKIAEIDESGHNFQPHRYEEGESFPYRGKNYQLLTLIGSRTEVTLNGDNIIVPLPPKLPEKAKSRFIHTTLELWYTRNAREILTEKTYQLGSLCHLQPASVGIKDYKSRWGCCFGDGRIYFNWRIIAAPDSIVDYVIIHELCHLVEPNHSKQYWKIVEKIIPDWKKRRGWLKQNGYTLAI